MNGKIIQILCHFKKREIKKFEEFLKSPFFNKNSRINLLFNELIKFYPEFKKKELTREYLFKKVFGSTNFNDSSIRNLLSDLLKLAEDFIAHQAIAKNVPEKHRIINDVMIERKAYNFMSKNMRIAEDELSKTVLKTPFYYYYKAKYSSQKLKANIEQNREYANLSGLYLETRNNLLNAFMYELMILYSNYSQLQIKETLWEEMTFLKEILYYLENNNYSSEPVLEIYYNLIKLQQTNNEDYYLRLRTILNVHNKEISMPDKRIAYFILYTYISNKFNQHDYSLFTEFISLTELFIENGFSNHESGYMSEVFFTNTVSIYNSAKLFKESENYIKKNHHLLNPRIRANTFNYCMGLIKFHSGLLDEALNWFSKTKNENFIMKMGLDVCRLIIYYELGYIENCFSLIDANNNYIKSNKKIRKNYSNHFFNFNTIFKKLLKLKEKPDKYELIVLKEKISAVNELASKKWLLNKIEELEK